MTRSSRFARILLLSAGALCPLQAAASGYGSCHNGPKLNVVVVPDAMNAKACFERHLSSLGSFTPTYSTAEAAEAKDRLEEGRADFALVHAVRDEGSSEISKLYIAATVVVSADGRHEASHPQPAEDASELPPLASGANWIEIAQVGSNGEVDRSAGRAGMDYARFTTDWSARGVQRGTTSQHLHFVEIDCRGLVAARQE